MRTTGQPGWSRGGGSSSSSFFFGRLPWYLLVAVTVIVVLIPSSLFTFATALVSQRQAGVASRSHSSYHHLSYHDSYDHSSNHGSYHSSYHDSHYHLSDHWNDGPYDTSGTVSAHLSVAHRIHQERERQWLTPFEECGRRFLDDTNNNNNNNNNASRHEELVTLCDPSATLTAMERQTIRNLAPDSTTNTTTAPMVVVVILPPERSVHKQNALPYVWFGVDCDRDRCDIGTFTGLLYRFFTTEVKPSSFDLLVISPTDQQAFIYVHSPTVRRTISVNPLHPLPPRSPNDDDDSSGWITLKYSLTTLMQQGEVVRAIQETVQWFLEAQPKESSSATTTSDPNSILVGQSLEKDKTQNGQPTMSSSTPNHLTAQDAGVHSKEPNAAPEVGLEEVHEIENGQEHLLVSNNGTQSKGQRSVSTDEADSEDDEQEVLSDSETDDNNREDGDEASTNPTSNTTKNKKNWWWISLGWLAAIAVAVAWCFQCCVVASLGTITCRECHTWCDDTKRWLRMVQNQWDLIHAGRALQGKFKATCCPICLESFQYRSGRGETLPLLSKHKHHQVGRMVGSDGLPLKLLPCGHVFDTTCWEEWACHCERDQLTCPVCRRRVEMFKPQARRNPFTTTSPLDNDSTMSEDHDDDEEGGNDDDDSSSGSFAHIVGQILAQQQQNSQLQRPIRPLPRVPHAPSSRHNIRTTHRTNNDSNSNSNSATDATPSSTTQRLSRAWYAQRLRASSSDALPQHEGDVPEWPFRPSSSSQQRTMGRRQRPSSSSPLLQRSRSSPPRSSPRPRRPQRHVRPSSSGTVRSSTATTLVTSRSDDSQDHLLAYPLSSFSSFWAIQQERIYQTFSDLQEPSSGSPERRRPETLTPQRQDSLLSVTTRWPDYDLEDSQDSFDEDDDDDAEARHRESQRQGLDSV